MGYPFKQAKNYYPGRQGNHPIWIVVHSAETDELGTSAEAVQNYFATTSTKASTHLISDNNSTVRSVLDADTAFGAKSANSLGLHIEHAGRAAQSSVQWDDAYSRTMLAEQSSPAVALWCREFDIPARFVDAAALKRLEPGITTHAEVNRAFPSSGHTDPGPNFPMAKFLELVRSHMQPHPPPVGIITPISTLGDDVPVHWDYYDVPEHPACDAEGDGATTLPWAFGKVGIVRVNDCDQNHKLARVDGEENRDGKSRIAWKDGPPNATNLSLIVQHWD